MFQIIIVKSLTNYVREIFYQQFLIVLNVQNFGITRRLRAGARALKIWISHPLQQLTGVIDFGSGCLGRMSHQIITLKGFSMLGSGEIQTGAYMVTVQYPYHYTNTLHCVTILKSRYEFQVWTILKIGEHRKWSWNIWTNKYFFPPKSLINIPYIRYLYPRYY